MSDYLFDQTLAEDAASEIRAWEGDLDGILTKFDTYADSWRQISNNPPGSLSGLSNAVTSETTRATETLATTMHRMILAQDPPFYLLPRVGDVLPQQIEKTTAILQWQLEHLDYSRKLLKYLRSLCLMGTAIAEESWMQWPPRVQNPMYEGTDFNLRSLLTFAFDPTCSDLNTSKFHTTIDFVSATQLRDMMASRAAIHPLTQMPLWDSQCLEDAINAGKNANTLTTRVRTRRSKAGYANSKEVYQLATRWGPTKDVTDSDCVTSIVNDRFVVGYYPSFLGTIRPFRIAHLSEFELEPYSYGIGAMGQNLISDLNKSRRLELDALVFNLYSMWKTSRLAGIKQSTLRIRPWGVIETDDMEGIDQLKTDLQAVEMGLKLEEIQKEEFRYTVGASPNLQAQVTDASATEVSIAQNEIIRRVSVHAEIIANEALRRHLIVSHQNNLQFLDQSYWLQIGGIPKPTLVSPSDLLRDTDFRIRVVTDKDFKPQRMKHMMELLQIITSVRNQLPPTVDVTSTLNNLISEITRTLGFAPPQPPPERPAGGSPLAMALLQKNFEQARSVAQNGGLNGVAKPSELADAQISTPGGPVNVSPTTFSTPALNGAS